MKTIEQQKYFSSNIPEESRMKELRNINFKYMYEKLEIKFELLNFL